MTDRPCILLVDDEPHVRDGLRTILARRRRAWRVLDAEGPDAAEAELARSRVDAVITDITMPRRDGLDLLASIRAEPRTRDIPVVVLTGLSSHDLKRRCLELGATDFLNKPADPDELVARMDNMLRLKSYQDDMKDRNRELERIVEARTAELRRANLEIIWRLARAAETRDTDTGQHVLRVGLYSRAIGEALGLEPTRLTVLQHAAMLHDVGKIGIPDRILNKPGSFTASERAAMEEHCRLGHALLTTDDPLRGLDVGGTYGDGSNPFLEAAAAIALNHHERWDGTGYPDGLAGDAIPLEARITAVADVFDALAADRVYRAAMPIPRALAILEEGRGSHFDPAVLDAFHARLDEILELHARYADSAQLV